MARQGWENALDDDMAFARSSGGGFWSGLLRVLLGLFVVGTLTVGAAYYLPLHRAHKALTEQFAALSKRVDTQDTDLKKLKTELVAAEADRDRLEAAQGQQEARQKADKERDTKLREVLTTKLAGFSKSHLSVVAGSQGTAVLLPPALVRMQGLELTEGGRNMLCSVIKSMSAVGPLTYRVGAFVSRTDAAGTGPREQSASRATNTARTMEERCAVPATRILSAGFMQPPASADSAAAGETLELDVALL
jgi:hypothetical protein